MPTPRHITQISRQVRTRAGGAGDGAWSEATVTVAGSDIGNDFHVSVDGGPSSAPARSVIDAPITVGSRVMVVKVGDEYKIVGVL